LSDSDFFLFFCFCLIWLVGAIAISIWYRKRTGKVIVPRAPASARFAEAWCSGRSLRNALTRLGGASNCLLVYVDQGDLVVTPKFPFTLMFLPEIYGLEIRAPLKSISSVREDAVLFGRALRIDFLDGKLAPMELRLRDPEGLQHALLGDDKTDHSAAPGISPRRRFGRGLFVRAFAAVWGTLALYSGLAGLQNDYQYLSHGTEVAGTIDGHTDEVGSRSDSGVLAYRVGGRTFHVVSLRGNGLYRIGETEKLRYIPRRPDQAREEDYLLFDLLWVSLGSAMILLVIFGGRLIKILGRLF